MKTAVMHDRETMLANLKAVNPTPDLERDFYPKLLDRAGTKLAGVGVNMTIMLALYDFLQGMPEQMTAVMYMMVPDFIDAMTDDEDVRAEAKSVFSEATK